MSYIDETVRRRAASRNVFHTVVLVTGIGLIAAFSAYVFFGGVNGVLWTLGAVAVFSLFAPRVAPEAIMAMFKARPVRPGEGGQVAEIIRVLAQRAGLQNAPKLYVIPSETLNAFAVGSRDSAALSITEGLLRRLELRELAGVLAHEITHVRNNDIWVMSLADMFGRLTRLMSMTAIFLGFFFLLTGRPIPWAGILILYFAPTLASLLQLALSRSREYDADLGAAELTGDPQSLASALNKLERYQGRMWEDMVLPGRRIPIPSVLRTHPRTEDRVERLLALQGRTAAPPIRIPEATARTGGFVPIVRPPRYHWTGFWF
jgi:heat shock protein HtpX